MPGPAPNPNARRRNDQSGWRTLPATCDRPAPRWPLTGRKPAGLVELWRHLWRLPVAEIWHEQGAERLLARYALLTLAVEASLAPRTSGQDDGDRPSVAAIVPELRQLEDRLLISPSTRLRARVIVDERPVEAPKKQPGSVTSLDEWRDLGVG